MLKKICLALLCMTLAFGAQAEEVYMDDTGYPVMLSSYHRVAALSGSLAQIWRLAGGEVAFLTDDALDGRDLGLSDDVRSVGSLKNPNAELLLSGGADLVLLTPTLSGHVALAQTLRAAGVTCVFLDVETFSDYLRALALCTAMTGQTDNFEQYGKSVQTEIEEITGAANETNAHPSVLLLRAYSTGVKAKNSENNMVGAMLRDLGCVNIADGGGVLEDLTLEMILVSDPDFIFITTMGDDDAALARFNADLQSSPAWAGLTAVKNGRCVTLPKELFHYKPCERWAESYRTLSEILNGEK